MCLLNARQQSLT